MKFMEDIFGSWLPWKQRSVIYEVTARCNLRCGHCYNVWKGQESYEAGELDTEKSLVLIRKAIKESRCENFTFTGGEPLLRTDLERLVAEASRRCHHVNIISNGTLFDAARVKSLIDAGATLFELPFNSSDRKVHDAMAGVEGSYDLVTRAAAEIRLAGGRFAFVIVVTKANVGSVRETLELGAALGAAGFLLNRYNAGGSSHSDPGALLPPLEKMRQALAEANAFVAERGVPVSASIAMPPCLIDQKAYPNLGFGFCAAGSDRAYYTIDPLGNLRPCNHTCTILGNLFQCSMKSLAKSKTMTEFKAARPDICAGCALELECQGGCKAAGEACYGSLKEPDPFLNLNADKMRKLGEADALGYKNKD